MDLNKLTNEELMAIKNGEFSKLSNETLKSLSADARLPNQSSNSEPLPKKDDSILGRIKGQIEERSQMSPVDAGLDAVKNATFPWKNAYPVIDALAGTDLRHTGEGKTSTGEKVKPRGASYLANLLARYGNSLTANLVNPVAAGVSSVVDEGLQAADVIPERSIGEAYKYYTKAQKDRAAQFQKDYPSDATTADIAGLVTPGGAMSQAAKVGQKAATAAKLGGAGAGILSKAAEGLVRGGVANALYGQVAADGNTPLADRGINAGIDFAAGGLPDAALSGGARTISKASEYLSDKKIPQKIYSWATGLGKEGGKNTDMVDILLKEGAVGSKDTLESLSAQRVKEIGGQLRSALSGKEANYDQIVSQIKNFEDSFASGERETAKNALSKVMGEFEGLFKSKAPVPSGIMLRPDYADFKADFLKKNVPNKGPNVYAPYVKIEDEIIGKLRSHDFDNNPNDVYGLRIIDSNDAPKIGDKLRESTVFVDGNPTDQTLGGTSTIGINLENAKEAFKNIESYFGDHLALVKGERVGWGEDIGEEILKNPEVVSVFKRKDFLKQKGAPLSETKNVTRNKGPNVYAQNAEPASVEDMVDFYLGKLDQSGSPTAPSGKVTVTRSAGGYPVNKTPIYSETRNVGRDLPAGMDLPENFFPKEAPPVEVVPPRPNLISEAPVVPTEDDIYRMYLQQYPDESIALAASEGGPKTINLADLNFEKSRLANSAKRLYDNPDLGAQATKRAQKEIADISRSVIEDQAPEVRDLNQRYHAYDALNDALTRASEKEFAQPMTKVGLADLGAGAVGGIPAVAAKRGLESTRAQTNIASFLFNLLNKGKKFNLDRLAPLSGQGAGVIDQAARLYNQNEGN